MKIQFPSSQKLEFQERFFRRIINLPDTIMGDVIFDRENFTFSPTSTNEFLAYEPHIYVEDILYFIHRTAKLTRLDCGVVFISDEIYFRTLYNLRNKFNNANLMKKFHYLQYYIISELDQLVLREHSIIFYLSVYSDTIALSNSNGYLLSLRGNQLMLESKNILSSPMRFFMEVEL